MYHKKNNEFCIILLLKNLRITNFSLLETLYDLKITLLTLIIFIMVEKCIVA